MSVLASAILPIGAAVVLLLLLLSLPPQLKLPRTAAAAVVVVVVNVSRMYYGLAAATAMLHAIMLSPTPVVLVVFSRMYC